MLDSKDDVYVTDMGNSRIQKFDSVGNFITMWGSKGSGIGEMNKPKDIAINLNNNNVYVTDTRNSRIIEFTLQQYYTKKLNHINIRFLRNREVDFSMYSL